MRRLRNVKVVATLGPASDSYDMIRALFEAGADVFRLNMSHGTQAEIAEKHRIIRQVEEDLNSPIAILADLQGPKLRCGVFANECEVLEEGPYGLSRLQSMYLFVRSDTIYGGTNQIQRNIIAERGLGMPREPKGPAK